MAPIGLECLPGEKMHRHGIGREGIDDEDIGGVRSRALQGHVREAAPAAAAIFGADSEGAGGIVEEAARREAGDDDLPLPRSLRAPEDESGSAPR